MPRSGRANWIVVALLVVVAAIVVLVLLGGETPTSAAQRFLAALGRGDAKTLEDMSYFNPPLAKDEVAKEWRYALDIGKHYRFAWRLLGETRPTPDQASVRVSLVKNFDDPASYEENYSIDMLKVNGRWMVDVRSINREVYPALPR